MTKTPLPQLAVQILGSNCPLGPPNFDYPFGLELECRLVTGVGFLWSVFPCEIQPSLTGAVVTPECKHRQTVVVVGSEWIRGSGWRAAKLSELSPATSVCVRR